MEDLLPHMRARIEQLRKVMSLAHDPRMIQMIQDIIDTGEADIAKLEAEPDKVAAIPPQPEAQS